MNGAEPYADPRDLFTRLANGHLDKDIGALMPWAYAAAPHPLTMSSSGVPSEPACKQIPNGAGTAHTLGRPRKVLLRRVWDAIQYLAAAGCAWSLLPKDFPPVSTVRYYFYRWSDDGLLAEIIPAIHDWLSRGRFISVASDPRQFRDACGELRPELVPC